MPRPNKLFYTLKSFDKRTSQISSSTSSSSVPATPIFNLEFKFSQEFKRHYALIHLPIPKIEDFEYEITEAHISFFENMSNSFDSGYHYTATLIKSNGELTKVRAYFNQDGSIRVDSNELTEIEKDLFKNNALREAQPIIEQIKAFQQTRITQLSTTISKILEDSDSGHLQKLEEINRLNKQCITALPLVQELESIGGTMKLGKKLFSRLDALDWAKTDLMQPLPPTSAVKGDKKDNKEKEEVPVQKKEHKRRAKNKFFDKSSSSQQSSAQAVAQSLESQKEKAWKDLRTSIDKLLEVEKKLQQYLGNKQSQGLIPTAELIAAQQIAKEALGSLLAYRVFEDEIPALDFLTIESSLRMLQVLGIHCFKALIPKFNEPKKREEALSLRCYAKYLDERFCCDAIVAGNAKLLDLLLEEGNFNMVEDLLIAVNGELIAPLSYVYRKNDLETFKVLLKHKASLYVDSGYKSPKQSLCSVISNQSKNNPFFLELSSRLGRMSIAEQQRSMLQACLQDPLITETHQKEKIQSVINKCTLYIEAAKKPSEKDKNARLNSLYSDYRDRISNTPGIGLFLDEQIFKAFRNALGLAMQGREPGDISPPMDTDSIIAESLTFIDKLARVRASSNEESTMSEEQVHSEIDKVSLSLSC